MTYISDVLRAQVEERAGTRCEYCHLPAQFAYHTHEIDHIYAEKHGGTTQIVIATKEVIFVRWILRRGK